MIRICYGNGDNMKGSLFARQTEAWNEKNRTSNRMQILFTLTSFGLLGQLETEAVGFNERPTPKAFSLFDSVATKSSEHVPACRAVSPNQRNVDQCMAIQLNCFVLKGLDTRVTLMDNVLVWRVPMNGMPPRKTHSNRSMSFSDLFVFFLHPHSPPHFASLPSKNALIQLGS